MPKVGPILLAGTNAVLVFNTGVTRWSVQAAPRLTDRPSWLLSQTEEGT